MESNLNRAVSEFLAPLGPQIWAAFTVAMDHCLRHQDGAWDKRLRATYIWNQAVAEFTKLTYGQPGIERVDQHGTVFYEVGGRFLLRFKKIGFNGRISRIRTKHSDVFLGQGLLFEDRPRCVNILVVYKLNEAETDIETISFALCNLRNEIVWRRDIPPPGIMGVAPLPDAPPTGGEGDVANVVARIRRDARDEAGLHG